MCGDFESDVVGEGKRGSRKLSTWSREEMEEPVSNTASIE